MNRRGAKIFGALLVLAGVLAILTGSVWLGVPATARADETSYWNLFKSVFVDWDDNAQPGTAQTEVCGVRGVNVEEGLGSSGYDWGAVAYMEDFQVSVADEMKFLKEGKLGPYQGR